jgi:iron complex outermembrane receptor protein
MYLWAALLGASAMSAPAATGDQVLPLANSDILVTAERRSQRAGDVPIAVSAIDGTTLERLPVRDLQDLQHYIPELQTSQFSRDETILVVRGQGPGVGAFPGVLTYFNEVPFRGLGDGFYYDLANVQLLKGPQGTLFGRNSNGGAILFTSMAPHADIGGYAQAEIGDYGDRQIQGAVNLPLAGDTLTLRLAGIRGVRSGYTRVVGGGRLDDRDYAGGRVSLRWQPAPWFRDDLVLDYTHVGTNDTSAILRTINPLGPIAQLPPALAAAAESYLAEQQALGPREQAGLSTDAMRRARQWGIQDRLTADLSSDLTITNIAAYRRYQLLFRSDYDGTSLSLLDYSITPSGNVVDDEQISEELQLHGHTGRIHYTAGAYYQHNQPAGRERQVGVIYYLPIAQINEADDLSRALYGQVDYDASQLLHGLKLSVGGRYTWDRRYQRAGTTLLGLGTCGNVGGVLPDCIASGTVRFSAPSWALTASWQPTPDVLFYVTSRHGYKGGGLNLGQPIVADQQYRPEYLTDVEIGAKSTVDFGQARLQVDADLYRGDYRHVQVNGLTALGGAVFNIVENGASATLQGLEFNSSLSLPGGVQFGANYAYTDAHYDRFISSIYGDLSNAPWPYTAKHRASLSAAWTLPVKPSLGRPTVGAHLSVQSHSTFGYDPDPFNSEPGYALLDLSLDWTAVAGGPVDASLFVTNATNKLYRTGSIGLYNTLGLSSSVYAAPRMVGMKLRIQFGKG